MDKTEVAYLCDGKRSCGKSEYCGVNYPGVLAPCYHTKDITHAINFECLEEGTNKFIEKKGE